MKDHIRYFSRSQNPFDNFKTCGHLHRTKSKADKCGACKPYYENGNSLKPWVTIKVVNGIEVKEF